MAIKDRTRKILWAKSGNRCSICRTKLISGRESTNEFNIGEECHIISRKPEGPRHKPDLEDYDMYDNLILLCRNHHREIDELTDKYTEDHLRRIKTNHENWVQKIIDKAVNSGKKTKPRLLARITSGKELLNIISGTRGYKTDYDEVGNEEDAQFIGSILQELIDYGDISSMVETYDKVQIGFELNKRLLELEEKGYYLFGERDIELIKFANGDVDKWPFATIVIKRKDNSEIIKIDLNDLKKKTND